MGNMFTKAKVVEKKTITKKAKEKDEVRIVGAQKYAAIDLVLKTLKTTLETLKPDILAQVSARFVKVGTLMEKRPESFKGVEGKGVIGCELRARSVNSPLDEETQALYKAAGIPMKTIDKVEAAYRFNPAYLSDQAMLEKISNALSKVKGLPEDIIEMQEGESKVVADDDALDVLFKQPAKVVVSMLEHVGVFALKPKFKDGDMDSALDIMLKELRGEETLEGEEEAA